MTRTQIEPSVDPALTALVNGVSRDAFALLGPHAEASGAGWVVRALQPAARSIEVAGLPEHLARRLFLGR